MVAILNDLLVKLRTNLRTTSHLNEFEFPGHCNSWWLHKTHSSMLKYKNTDLFIDTRIAIATKTYLFSPPKVTALSPLRSLQAGKLR